MDPQVKNIMVSVGVIYHAATLLLMVAMGKEGSLNFAGGYQLC